MQKLDFKAAAPHLVGLATFLITAVVYFKPLVEANKIIRELVSIFKKLVNDDFRYVKFLS